MDGQGGLGVTINIGGIPEVLAKVRGEVSSILREVAAAETDQRVASRLHVIDAMLTQRITQAEAELRIANAPVTGTPRMGQSLVRSGSAPKPLPSGPSAQLDGIGIKTGEETKR